SSARTQRQEPSGSRSQAPGTRYQRAANLSSKKTHTHNSLPQIGRIEGPGQSRRAVLMSEPPISAIRKPGGHSEGCSTRSHPELGRENPQPRWYCRSSAGRGGRRQAFRTARGCPSNAAGTRLFVEPYGSQAVTEKMTWTDVPALHVRPVGNNPVPPQCHQLVRLIVHYVLL